MKYPFVIKAFQDFDRCVVVIVGSILSVEQLDDGTLFGFVEAYVVKVVIVAFFTLVAKAVRGGVIIKNHAYTPPLTQLTVAKLPSNLIGASL